MFVWAGCMAGGTVGLCSVGHGHIAGICFLVGLDCQGRVFSGYISAVSGGQHEWPWCHSLWLERHPQQYQS